MRKFQINLINFNHYYGSSLQAQKLYKLNFEILKRCLIKEITYVLGTFLIDGWRMNMTQTVPFPTIPTTKIIKKSTGTM